MRFPVVFQLLTPLEVIELVDILGHHCFGDIPIMNIKYSQSTYE